MTKEKYNIHSSCLICNSNQIYPLKNYSDAYLVKCTSCSFVFSERIPTNEELIAHYNTYGRNDYLSPITVKRYHEILDFLEPYRKTNNLIDIGCGIGLFLEVAKNRGWNVFGTEYTDIAISICQSKGINMHQGVLNTENYAGIEFDVIVSIEVLEHINNPQQEIGNFNKILRSGGAVYLTTPNFNSITRDFLKQKWSIIEYPEHLSYYTNKTITKLFGSNGFAKKYVKTTGFSLARFQTSPKKLTNDTIAKKEFTSKFVYQESADEKIRVKLEGNFLLKLLKSFLNSILSFSKKGDSLKALFVKS